MSLEGLYDLPPEQQEYILSLPALAPPDNTTLPNFDNPPNRNAMSSAAVTATLTIATVAIVLRAACKICVQRRAYIEDALVFVGWVFLIGFSYCVYRMIDGIGFFVHQWNVQVRDMSEVLWLINMATNFYAVSVACLKIGILHEWQRIFVARGTRTWFWWACWALIVVNIMFYIAAIIGGNLSCIPHRKIWDRAVPGHCINRKALDTATAAINLMSTIFILLLPQRIIWSLNMSFTRKLGLASIFTVGLLAIMSAAFRLAATVTYLRSDDVTYTLCAMALWCQAEMFCAILVFCIPAIPKLFAKDSVFTRLASSLRFSSWSGWTRGSGERGRASSWEDTKPSTVPTQFSDGTYQQVYDGTPLGTMGTQTGTSTEYLRTVDNDTKKGGASRASQVEKTRQ